MNQQARSFTTAIVAALLLLGLISYVGSYYMLLDNSNTAYVLMIRDQRGAFIVQVTPEYLFGGEKARTFYRPVHEIDRRLRPGLWTRDPGMFGIDLVR